MEEQDNNNHVHYIWYNYIIKLGYFLGNMQQLFSIYMYIGLI